MQIKTTLRSYFRRFRASVEAAHHLTKSRKASAKNCGQIVANRVRASVLQLDDVFAIAGFGLLFDALLPFGPPARRGRILRWSPLVAAVSQLWADLGRF